MKTATAIAVKTTIMQLTTVGEGVLVKRKYKTAGDESKRIVRWWFVVRGEEETLQILQKEWSQISAQTTWKLEPLYSYGESVSVSHSSLTNHQQFPVQTPHSTAQLHQQGEPLVTMQPQQPQQTVHQQSPEPVMHCSPDQTSHNGLNLPTQPALASQQVPYPSSSNVQQKKQTTFYASESHRLC